jgi:hypothetical protein
MCLKKLVGPSGVEEVFNEANFPWRLFESSHRSALIITVVWLATA